MLRCVQNSALYILQRTRRKRTRSIFIGILALAVLSFVLIKYEFQASNAAGKELEVAGKKASFQARKRIPRYNVNFIENSASSEHKEDGTMTKEVYFYAEKNINDSERVQGKDHSDNPADRKDIQLQTSQGNMEGNKLKSNTLKSTLTDALTGKNDPEDVLNSASPRNEKGKKFDNQRYTEITPNATGRQVINHAVTHAVTHVDLVTHGTMRKPFNSNCPKLFISDKNETPYGKCQPHQPSQEACAFAKTLYYLDPELTTCKTPSKGEICSVATRFKCHCDRTLCDETAEVNSIFALTVDPADGELVTAKSFSNTKELEDELPSIIQKCIEDKFPFMFLKCRRRGGEGDIVTQLLPVPARFTLSALSQLNSPRPVHALNVNILLLDSVSRAHFYRSLPKTIKLFKSWSSSTSNAPAEVFDFELFQAVEGHTAENTHAMFTGRFFPPHKEDELLPVEMGFLFGHFERAGYQTMWQEDLCWKGIWGLMTDLGVWDWEGLQEELKKNHIHQTGLTQSSCEILTEYGLESPFNGPKGNQICSNGQFQHTYLLEYTLDMLRAVNSTAHAPPLLSYMSLSVGHEHVGRRLQTLDSELVHYLKNVATDENTITILLADHGNTYTEYASTIMEGRFEMFHPSLFVIVPHNVARMLGKEAIRALRTNQRRLTTVIDLHHTLMALAGPIPRGVRGVGVFGPISDTRTCENVELRTPNLCVCEGWDSPTTNDTLKIALVEFAIGQLNNKIDHQYRKTKGKNKAISPLLRSCGRLKPVRFENVRERNSKSGSLVTSMDIYVSSDVTTEHAQLLDVFRVEIESNIAPDQDSLDLKLLNSDRGTSFAQYKHCADPGVSLKLCICSSKTSSYKPKLSYKSGHSLLSINSLKSYSSFRGVSPMVKKLNDGNNCLYILKRNHSDQSFAYDILNLCTDAEFIVYCTSNHDNIKYSRNVPFKVKVFPGSVVFVLSARKDIREWDSSIHINIKIILSRHVKRS